MEKIGKFILVPVLLVILAALVLFCVLSGSRPRENEPLTPEAESEKTEQTALSLENEAEKAWENENAVPITLSDGKSRASSAGVKIEGDSVLISAPGNYRVSGKLSHGQLAVDCEGEVTLILDGVEICNPEEAALTVWNADHTLIYLPEGRENKLVSGTEREITAADGNADVESASGAALYARDELSFAGSGKLTVCGYLNNAVASTDSVTVLGGVLSLSAVNNGLKGKDSVTVIDGTIDIFCGNDGIKADNVDDADCGNIEIRGGEVNIVSLGDGVQAEKNLSVSDGIITVSAGGAAGIGLTEKEEFIPGNRQDGETPPAFGETPPEFGETPPELPEGAEQGNMPGDRPALPTGEEGNMMPPGAPGFPGKENGGGSGRKGMQPERFDEKENAASETNGGKGFKSGGDISVSGGSVTVTSRDDAIHADQNVSLSGGVFLLSSGGKGIHADGTLSVSDGEITVSLSEEGLEGNSVLIDGGILSLTASDDGINASGDASPLIRISGGSVSIDAEGDGLDSNGDLIVCGGVTVVDGPTNGGNGALDSGSENGGKLSVNGGTVFAIGAKNMAETFGSESEQCSFLKTFSSSFPAGTEIEITDESGKTLFEHKSAKSFDSVVFSSPELVLGSTVTVSVGDQTESISLENISNGTSSGFGQPGGFGRKR